MITTKNHDVVRSHFLVESTMRSWACSEMRPSHQLHKLVIYPFWTFTDFAFLRENSENRAGNVTYVVLLTLHNATTILVHCLHRESRSLICSAYDTLLWCSCGRDRVVLRTGQISRTFGPHTINGRPASRKGGLLAFLAPDQIRLVKWCSAGRKRKHACLLNDSGRRRSEVNRSDQLLYKPNAKAINYNERLMQMRHPTATHQQRVCFLSLDYGLALHASCPLKLRLRERAFTISDITRYSAIIVPEDAQTGPWLGQDHQVILRFLSRMTWTTSTFAACGLHVNLVSPQFGSARRLHQYQTISTRRRWRRRRRSNRLWWRYKPEMSWNCGVPGSGSNRGRRNRKGKEEDNETVDSLFWELTRILYTF